MAGGFDPPDRLAGELAAVPTVALGADGVAIVAWQQQATAGGPYIVAARARGAGPSEIWGETSTLAPEHEQPTLLALATDARGDFALVTTVSPAPDRPLGDQSSAEAFWFYDVTAPVAAPPTATGSLTAGSPVAFAVDLSDTWSAVGPPTWSFGDGSTGSGFAPSHTYAAAGRYVVRADVVDGGGNTTAAETVVTIARMRATFATASFHVSWSGVARTDSCA